MSPAGHPRPLLALVRSRIPLDTPDSPGFDISGDSRGCNRARSTFETHEIKIANDMVTRLLATFEQHCETPDAPPSLGVIDFTT